MAEGREKQSRADPMGQKLVGVWGQGPGLGSGSTPGVRAGGLEVGAQRAPRLLYINISGAIVNLTGC